MNPPLMRLRIYAYKQYDQYDIQKINKNKEVLNTNRVLISEN